MARLLYRLGSTAYRRWYFFIAAWLLVAVAVGSLAAAFAKPVQDEFTIPGIPSEQAADLQSELFPGSQSAFDDVSVNVVVATTDGSSLSAPQNQAVVDELIAEIPTLPQMSDDPADNPRLIDPTWAATAQEQQYVEQAQATGGDVATAEANAAATSPLSEDGTTGILTFGWDVDAPTDIEPASQEALTDLMDDLSTDTVQIEANGSGMSSTTMPGGESELIGIGIALVVLLLTFGSLVAAGMPIVNAMIGVGLGIAGITAATALTDSIGSTTSTLATMLGLAVGIDYTLFILARYRNELHHTKDRAHAAGIAVGTAGSAVVFAGLTVLIALAALAVVGIPFLTAMGFAAAGTVFLSVLVALTLLPAVLGLLKSKAFGGTIRKYRPRRDEQGLILNNGVRWARLLGRAPLAAAVLVVIVLGALAVPIGQMQLAFPTDSTSPSDTTQRQASDLITESFGPGREGPLLVVVDGRDIADDQQRQTAFGEVAAWAAGQDDVANAQVVATNAQVDPATGEVTGPATGAMIQVLPESGPNSQATLDLLESMRERQGDVEAETGTTVGVTGLTAITTDVSDRLIGALAPYLAVVIGLAFVLLMLVFRSVLVPLTATLGFLLSVLATLGTTVLVFQEGVFGLFEGQPIIGFLPIILIGIVFGLAMDYQVFLVTRMREAHVHGMTTREAVVDGFRNSARVVTAAATIMIAVFSAFMLMDDPIIKSMGFALAISIVFDAFIVRMVLIPAVLYLLGERAWWLPAWLERLLPNVDVEGEALERDSIPGRTAGADDVDPDLEPVAG